jgi:tetratricopeptide (TPR) repeat protein
MRTSPPTHGRDVILALALLCVAGVQAPAHAGQVDASARDAYRRALELQASGDHAGALSLLWDAAGRAPRDPDIQNGLGEALERVGALDAAIMAYRGALAVRPAFRKASKSLILALVKAGRSPEAVDHARTIVAMARDDPDAHFTLGLAWSELDVDAAIESFHRALALQPRHALARYNLALVLKRADRLAEAAAELRRVIEIEPRAEAHYTLGVVYWHQGELDRAVAALRAAIDTEPGYADAHHTLGAVLHARRDIEGAAAALRRALALRPDLAGAHDTMARVARAAGDRSAAERHLAEAERLRERARLEQEARVWTSVGTAKLEAGDANAAVECFQRATAAFDAYAPAYYQMGRAFERLGRPGEARAAFARAQQLNPSLVPPPFAR